MGGSFRINFESGQSVYIYVETYDNAIIARFDTRETDSVKRYQEIGSPAPSSCPGNLVCVNQ
ncbi:MAG: hypothetical protein R2875_10040 [Desulfobacterales bacterium]